MDKEQLMEMLKELFAEKRIEVKLDNYTSYGEKGIKVEVRLDGEVVYDDKACQKSWMD